MNQVSERLASLSPSQTLAMSQKSNELKAQGIDVINLSNCRRVSQKNPDHLLLSKRQHYPIKIGFVPHLFEITRKGNIF